MTRISAYLCLMLLLLLQCDVKQIDVDGATPYLTIENKEIQSLVEGMSLDEKLGQLLILETSLSPTCTEDSIYTYVKESLISGLILSDIDAIQYMRVVDNCTAFSNKRFLHGTRENVSISNQFSNTLKFPSLAAMNICSRDSLVQSTNEIFGQQLAAFNFDFAIGPNINHYQSEKAFDPNNFGTRTNVISSQARTHLNRLNSSGTFGIANNLNHFIDPKSDTLALSQDLQLIKTLSKVGLSGLMIGPGFFLDQDFSELPFEFLKSHLHQKYEFDGLMTAGIKNSTIQKLLHAGVDLIFVNDVRKQKKKLLELYQKGILSDAILDEKVARILKTKKWITESKRGKQMDVEAANFYTHYEEYDFLIRSLQESSVAVTHNHNRLLPLKNLSEKKFTIHNLGTFDAKTFIATFKKFADTEVYQRYDHVNEVLDLASLSEDIGSTNVYLYDASLLTHAEREELIDKIHSHNGVESILINFGNPDNIAPFKSHVSSVHSFDNTQYAQSAAAQLIFGAYNSNTRLVMDINEFIKARKNYPIRKIRLKYSDPREAGIDPTDLVGIDAIVNSAIDNKAIPGCQVLVAKSGKIIYSKGFGHQTYHERTLINTESLYDLASVSKVAGTTLATMKLVEENKLNFKDRLRNILQLEKKSRLKNIYLRDLLLHRSNLQPNMPISDFVEVEDSLLYACNEKYCYSQTEKHSQAVAKNFFMNKNQIDTLWDKVYGLKPYKKSKYRYSDVNFNLLHKVIEHKGKQKLDRYLDNKFYDRIGLRNLGYNPLNQHKITSVVPTEFDKRWRKQVVHGFVHDEAAALQGGVAGSAGLFSNAEDLAYLFQMILNGGSYGGKRFLKPETIETFVTPPYYSRRGYGFDKPRGKYTESCSSKASKSTYGHSGFTGTCVWVDPDTELVYIFLSNRIYPDANNRKLFKDKYRGRIHTVIYNALDGYKWKAPNPDQASFETKPIQS